jgi:hypothetical protein
LNLYLTIHHRLMKQAEKQINFFGLIRLRKL